MPEPVRGEVTGAQGFVSVAGTRQGMSECRLSLRRPGQYPAAGGIRTHQVTVKPGAVVSVVLASYYIRPCLDPFYFTRGPKFPNYAALSASAGDRYS